ncbi:hypothetical protein [uncultured Methanobrevibacter sp.]|uniref:hypothetical protein n=1 Tax=uncultured Methanobrevibacter sp. TaxID=253161 RepID=UPI0025F52FC3|nr:hypothetical protein [uncultured Methanobrevibacter sp.]
MKSTGTIKNGKITSEIGKLKSIDTITRKISVDRMKITNIAKTLLAPIEIAPLNKNSLNLDKYISGMILSKNKAKSSIILRFMK